jgi:hypothetical protein
MIFDYSPITGLSYTSPVHIPIIELPTVKTAAFISRWQKIQNLAGLVVIDCYSDKEDIDPSFFYPVIKTNALEPK